MGGDLADKQSPANSWRDRDGVNGSPLKNDLGIPDIVLILSGYLPAFKGFLMLEFTTNLSTGENLADYVSPDSYVTIDIS